MIRVGGLRVQAVIGPPGLGPRQGSDVEALRSWALGTGGLGDRQVGYAIAGIQSIRMAAGGSHPILPVGGVGSAVITCEMAVPADTAAGEISHADVEDWISGTAIAAQSGITGGQPRVENPAQAEPVIVTVMSRDGDSGPWWPRFSGWVRGVSRQRSARTGIDRVIYYVQETATWLAQANLYPELLFASGRTAAMAAETAWARVGRILDMASYVAHRTDSAIDTSAPTSAAWDLAVPRSTRGRTGADDGPTIPADTAEGQNALGLLRQVAKAALGQIITHHGIGAIPLRTSVPATVATAAAGSRPSADVQLDWGGVLTFAPGVVTPAQPGEVADIAVGTHPTPVRFTQGDIPADSTMVEVSVEDLVTDLDLHRHANVCEWQRTGLDSSNRPHAAIRALNAASSAWVRHAGWSPDVDGEVLVGTDAELRELAGEYLAAWQRPRRTMMIDVGEVGGADAEWAAQRLSVGHKAVADIDGDDVDIAITATEEQITEGSWTAAYTAAARSQRTKIGLVSVYVQPRPAPPPVDPVEPAGYDWLHIRESLVVHAGDEGARWRSTMATYRVLSSTLNRWSVYQTNGIASAEETRIVDSHNNNIPAYGTIVWVGRTTLGTRLHHSMLVSIDGDGTMPAITGAQAAWYNSQSGEWRYVPVDTSASTDPGGWASNFAGARFVNAYAQTVSTRVYSVLLRQDRIVENGWRAGQANFMGLRRPAQ